MLTFRKHTDTINTKSKRGLNVLRALTRTNHGHSKEHITTVYKQFIRPILTYAHTAWQSLLKDANLNKLITIYIKFGITHDYRLYQNNTKRSKSNEKQKSLNHRTT